ncbi:hypothetical protein NPIL_487531 [Nephila pilipes]|uniref:Uncharacterized protein n=1 Tax=Nephila pilipes TaxID=299642 RepID=A0A8X6UAB5_NEPPI|nr:hypothetical protein NPIL_487531 [Nephila pilipes]
MADKINEFSSCSSAVVGVSTNISNESKIQSFLDEVEKLRGQISWLTYKCIGSPFRISILMQRKTFGNNPRDKGLRLYDFRFSLKATKYVQLCGWSGNAEASLQR